MTLKQFDAIYLELQKLVHENKHLSQQVEQLTKEVNSLQQKTLLVTTLDQDLEKLKVDVAALIDERRA